MTWPNRKLIAFAAAMAFASVAPAVTWQAPEATRYPEHAYRIVSPFGSYIGIGGGRRERPNDGVDIIARVRTPVYAAEHGEVRRVAIETRRGRVIEITTTRTTRPYTLVYTHLHGAEVEPGGTVRAGQRIGSVGDTGQVPRGIAYLHFEVLAPGDGKPLDPESFLRSRPSGAIQCVDPEIAMKDPEAGGYGFDRFAEIRSGARAGAPLLYPVACLRE